MKNIRRIFAMILSLVLMISILPERVSASNMIVAKIGDKTFNTLQEAVDSAAPEDVIKVLENVTETVRVDKGVTIDLEGHTISGSTESYAFYLNTTNNRITIQNGTIIGGKSTKTESAGAIKVKNSVFTLKNLDIKNSSGYGYALLIQNGNIKDKELTSQLDQVNIIDNQTNIMCVSNSATFEISNCNFLNNIATDKNSSISIGGRGEVIFNNSKFKNNSSQNIFSVSASFNNCEITNNIVTDSTFRDGSVRLNNSVVKNNTGSSEYHAAGMDTEELFFNNSAVYKNKNTTDGRVDIGKNLTDVNASLMKDSTDPSFDFTNCKVLCNGAVGIPVEQYEAQIGDVKYKELLQALYRAKSGETVKLIYNDDLGRLKDVCADYLGINQGITIDLNNHNTVHEGTNVSFVFNNNQENKLINSSEGINTIKGKIKQNKFCHLYIGNNVDVIGDICVNENTIIDGNHGRLDIQIPTTIEDETTPQFKLGDDFKLADDNSTINLNLIKLKSDLNSKDKAVPDKILATNVDSRLLKRFRLVDVRNQNVKLVIENKNLILKKSVTNSIYLNGISGADTNDGSTKEKAVKTFEVAKKKAEALSCNGKDTTIYICGTVSIENKRQFEIKDSSKIKIQRELEYTENLLKVEGSGNLTLKNISINGYNAKNNKSLIMVEGSSANLNIEEGTLLEDNNSVKTEENPPSSGGAVYVKNGTLNVNGGIFMRNSAVWGGAIYGYAATINVTDGKFDSNTAEEVKGETAAGGAIALGKDSKLNISGGEFINNISDGQGGAVSVGTSRILNDNKNPITLNVTGGVFDNNIAEFSGNIAKFSGGAIFVQGGYENGYGKAIISKGIFKNNKALKGAFGGGAIYVNGYYNYSGTKIGTHSGELHLKNALISGNKAELAGGGL